MDDAQSDETRRGFVARRVRMPSNGVESWTVIGSDGRAVEVIDDFLGDCPNGTPCEAIALALPDIIGSIVRIAFDR